MKKRISLVAFSGPSHTSFELLRSCTLQLNFKMVTFPNSRRGLDRGRTDEGGFLSEGLPIRLPRERNRGSFWTPLAYSKKGWLLLWVRSSDELSMCDTPCVRVHDAGSRLIPNGTLGTRRKFFAFHFIKLTHHQKDYETKIFLIFLHRSNFHLINGFFRTTQT